ncbi:hypothetical protein SYNTR_1764 [Candidatus Syntrophocurvum alkaliphilum]|uniref:Uncharacterized protein n=1 Tax=Candidatus Syntrophocurvum alkaliphilum TaxID=2293317 RepID=A0A6I6DMW6_9FIRM|nr:sugar-binding domain-containing protein [Candidatus Syntrophocurvum alkaliphilum]QGU00358.1 hypothetical protein SYNTR_1764 [Candidatus Syntrophocurvum alkaliphilum]
MERLFTIVERCAPELLDALKNRYQILKQVFDYQPIGRRQIAKNLGYSERLVRSELDRLKERGILYSTPSGINLTVLGEGILNEMNELVPYLFSTGILEQKFKEIFNLKEAIIVPGDSMSDPFTKKDIGRAAARFLQKAIFPGCTVAVTGGTTLAEMAEAVDSSIDGTGAMIVPARGGLGEDMEQQASVIAAKIAKTIGAQYKLLHIPDYLEENTAEILKKDANISKLIKNIKFSNILIHGIGPAIDMAKRRGLSELEINFLKKQKALAESLRYYYDKVGNIVYELPGIGLEKKDLENVETIVAVAGGSNKTDAIEAVLNSKQLNVLITDEGAAKKILERMN